MAKDKTEDAMMEPEKYSDPMDQLFELGFTREDLRSHPDIERLMRKVTKKAEKKGIGYLVAFSKGRTTCSMTHKMEHHRLAHAVMMAAEKCPHAALSGIQSALGPEAWGRPEQRRPGTLGTHPAIENLAELLNEHLPQDFNFDEEGQDEQG